MIAKKARERDRANKVARLEADNGRLHKVAAELDAELRELRGAAARKRGGPAIDPAHRLLVVGRGDRRAGGT